MHAQGQTQFASRRSPSLPIYANEGLSPKKTALIIVTVVGCIAILWPKVLYPMMFASSPATSSVKANAKEGYRGPGGLGCCDVVLNREEFYNATSVKKPKTSDGPFETYGPHLYRKSLNLYTGEISIRQERPSHLHPESVYQAMRERGRAIPATTTIPVMERKSSPSNPPPRIVEGRPGPIPGMRPPMGAGSMHQPQGRSQNSMGIIMPLYTIGIVVFFGYTIMKIVFKKQIPNAPYGAAPNDPNFRKQVFGHENGRHVEDLNNPKLVVTAIQGLIDAADEELKIRETSTTDPPKKESHENSTSTNQQQQQSHEQEKEKENIYNGHANDNETLAGDDVTSVEDLKATGDKRKRREGSTERSVSVLGMEISASCESGQKWPGRPPTPVLLSHHQHSKHEEDDIMPEPQEIYLEGSLAHDSQILVAESETKQENVYDAEINGSPEEPAVVLSSKMTLSLINMDNVIDKKAKSSEPESPLADDIEIIGHDEHKE